MKSVTLIAMAFLSVLSPGVSGSYGTFTEHPQDYSAVEGTTHSFRCTFKLNAEHQAFTGLLSYDWSVRILGEVPRSTNIPIEKTELEALGINFNANVVTFPANRKTNGSIVQCRAPLLDSGWSKRAQLTVLGPPTPPQPALTAVNDMLKFSWAPAWSWDNHPVTHYTVTLTNTTDGTVYTNQTNETVWYFTHEEGAEPRCDVMMVNVTATSDIGEGEAGQVMGGFPISPAPFKMINCSDCEVTFLSSLAPMYTISFKLPDICPYQTGHYNVLLYGSEVPVPIVEETEYTTANTVTPLTFNVDSTALTVNNTYTVVVFVSNSEGTTNASITFDTVLRIPPHLQRDPTVIITVAENNAALIAGIIIGVVLLIAIIVVVVVIVIMYRRRRRSGVAELNLAKIFMEDHHRPPRGGPYTQTETRIYESIDGYQGKNFDPSPAYPPPIPSMPPLRAEHHYTPDHLTVPRITFDGEKDRDSNAYLQLLSENGKTDPDVRSTGSGDYTAMKSVSLRNGQPNNMAAVNKMALQTPQGFNEDNYMVFMEQGDK